jgi:hypothetical protein
MLIFHIVVAHLLGDFVFQSNSLLAKKYKSWTGTLQHALIITLFTALVLFPFWGAWHTWLIVGTIGTIHFAQDVLKVEFDKRHNKKKSLIPFFLDQLMHLSLIVLLGQTFYGIVPFSLPVWLDWLYFTQWVPIMFSCVILISHAFDITVFQFKLRREKKNLKYHYDISGMLPRVLGFSIFYLIFLIFYKFVLGGS